MWSFLHVIVCFFPPAWLFRAPPPPVPPPGAHRARRMCLDDGNPSVAAAALNATEAFLAPLAREDEEEDAAMQGLSWVDYQVSWVVPVLLVPTMFLFFLFCSVLCAGSDRAGWLAGFLGMVGLRVCGEFSARAR